MKITKSQLREIIREELNEAQLKDVVPDIIFAAAQYTSKKLDHIARQSWDSAHELTKQIMQSIPVHKWTSFRKDVNKLLKQHSIRESINEETDKDAALDVLGYLESAYKLSKKYPPKKWDYDVPGIGSHPVNLALSGATRYWDGRIAKDLGIRRDIDRIDAETPNVSTIIAKIIKKAKKNIKKGVKNGTSNL